MLDLESAIKHCEEVAEKNEKECKNWAYGASRINDDESRKKHYLKHAEMWKEYAKEHRQLAEWLRMLKKYNVIFEKIGKILADNGYTMDDLETIFGKANDEEVNADECM